MQKARYSPQSSVLGEVLRVSSYVCRAKSRASGLSAIENAIRQL
jgi:hypothetical protein